MRIAGAVAAIVVAAAMLAWNARHRLPIVWDEANYYLQTRHDVRLASEGGAVRLAKAFVFEDVERPPAYRVIAFPLAAAGGSLRALRLLSILFFLLTAAVLALAVRSSGGDEGLTLLVFALSPGVILSFQWFGTDYPLLLAAALLLAAMAAGPRGDVVLTALGVALGLLSKTSFLIFGASLLGARLVVEPWRGRGRVAAASVAGAIIAAPWWWWNARAALGFANYSREFPRLAYGAAGSLRAMALNAEHLLFGAIGLPAAIAILIALTRRAPFDRRTVIPAVAAALVLPAIAFLSPWLLERHVAPSVAALAFAAGVLRGAPASRPAGHAAVPAAFFTLQLFLILTGLANPQTSHWPPPARLLAEPLETKDNVDWSFLRSITPEAHPKIAFFGLAPSLTPPELALAFNGDAEVTWLWRLEDGPIDWPKIENKVRSSDMILVPDPLTVHPDAARGLQERDLAIHNAHIAEFVTLVESTALFQPTTRRILNINPYTVRIYIRRRG